MIRNHIIHPRDVKNAEVDAGIDDSIHCYHEKPVVWRKRSKRGEHGYSVEVICEHRESVIGRQTVHSFKNGSRNCQSFKIKNSTGGSVPRKRGLKPKIHGWEPKRETVSRRISIYLQYII